MNHTLMVLKFPGITTHVILLMESPFAVFLVMFNPGLRQVTILVIVILDMSVLKSYNKLCNIHIQSSGEASWRGRKTRTLHQELTMNCVTPTVQCTG